MELSASKKELHDRAVSVCREYNKNAWRVVEILQELDQTKLYKWFGCPSLFDYAVKLLGLDESVAYPMINAARKAREIPRLNRSLKEQRLSLAKAARILSTVNVGNADELIAFAESHTANEINREVARIRKREGLPDRTSNIKVSNDTLSKIRRAQSVLSKGRRLDPDQVLNQALDELLERHDPVRKAKRAEERKSAKAADTPAPSAPGKEIPSARLTKSDTILCTYRVSRRKPLTADEKHQVFARDGGQCTHIDAEGRRCTNDRYLHIHHIRPVSQGGGNEPDNLTTLCSFHHDQAHQLAFPIEGQITWLRDLRVPYG